MVAFEYIILVLLVISLVMNIFLYAKVKQLNRELQEVSSKVDITKDELSQIRARINRMKGEL